MKRLYSVLAGLLIIALFVAGAVYWVSNRAQQSAGVQTSRFAPLAADGAGSSASALSAGPKSRGDMEVIEPVQFDLSKPLSEMGALPPEQGPERKDRGDELKHKVLPGRPNSLDNFNPNSGFLDAALQRATEANAPVNISLSTPIANFDGLTNVNGVLPPDTNGDIGPNHYMQWVNLSFAIYSRTGTLLFGPAAGNSLWAGFGGVCQTTNNGDPIVLYDHLADRWMVSQFAVPGGASGYHQCIAVSQTPDPTGAWYRYDFLWSTTNMNDYPHFGVWPDGYYMTVHEFANASTWAGQGVAVFEREKMLQGLTARMVKFNLYATDPNLGGMLPTDLDGPAPAAGTPNYFVEPDDNAYGFPQDQVQIFAFHVDWTNTANSSFTQANVLPTAAFDANMCGGLRNCIPQQGTTVKLDAISDRAMYRAQYRNFGSYQTIVMNHTVDVNNTDLAGVRWYELRNSGSGWSIYQQGTFSPDSTRRWMGSIAMNGQGDIGLGYSASSSTMYPALRYTGRLSTDPLGSMTQGEGVLIAGTGAQTHTASRWGDYSMLSVDPTDDCTFWFTSEYVATTGSAPWRTRIGSFKVADCGPVTTGTIAGTVTNSATSAPVSGATVTIVGGASTTTNASGAYSFSNVTPGTYDISASASGYNSATNTGVSVTAGSTSTSNFALTPIPVLSTGFLAPTANAAVTTSSGDNNGYQTNPTNAYLADGIFATDGSSGTGTSTSCTSNAKDKHLFYNYNFSLPGAATVKGIEVQLTGKINNAGGSPKFCIQISWNGGTSWTTAKNTTNLTTTNATYTLGTSADTWGRTWLPTEFGNSTFRIRIIDVASNTNRTFSLDAISVQVTYQP